MSYFPQAHKNKSRRAAPYNIKWRRSLNKLLENYNLLKNKSKKKIKEKIKV